MPTHHRHWKNSIIIACIIVSVVFAVGLCFSLSSKGSFYQKLSDGLDVNVLIIGDSIGNNAGASDASLGWTALVAKHLEDQYGIHVTLTNVSMGGNTSYAGYVRTMALSDNIDYDLAVLCYGQNDSPENFGLYYESIIRAINSKYPKCSIISILESSQREYTEKITTIKSIAEYYGIPVADTIRPFNDGTNGNYSNLTIDGTHPNDSGQKIYADSIESIIDNLAETYTDFDHTVYPPMNKDVQQFESFLWIDSSQFVRNDNTYMYTANEPISGILGIDYSFLSGENSCRIKIDDQDFSVLEVTSDHDASQRHIRMVDNDQVTIAKTIEISFSTKEQADEFNGCCFSWQ